MKYLLAFMLSANSMFAAGFLQDLADQYFEQGKYERKDVDVPKAPTKPTIDTPQVGTPMLPVKPAINEKKENQTKHKRDKNTTKLQNFFDKLLKQNGYEDR